MSRPSFAIGRTRAEAIDGMHVQWTASLNHQQTRLDEGRRLIVLAGEVGSATSSLGTVRAFQATSSRGDLRWVARLDGASGEEWTGWGKSRTAALADLRRTWDRHCAPAVKEAKKALAWFEQSVAQLADDGGGTGLLTSEAGGFLHIMGAS